MKLRSICKPLVILVLLMVILSNGITIYAGIGKETIYSSRNNFESFSQTKNSGFGSNAWGSITGRYNSGSHKVEWYNEDKGIAKVTYTNSYSTSGSVTFQKKNYPSTYVLILDLSISVEDYAQPEIIGIAKFLRELGEKSPSSTVIVAFENLFGTIPVYKANSSKMSEIMTGDSYGVLTSNNVGSCLQGSWCGDGTFVVDRLRGGTDRMNICSTEGHSTSWSSYKKLFNKDKPSETSKWGDVHYRDNSRAISWVKALDYIDSNTGSNSALMAISDFEWGDVKATSDTKYDACRIIARYFYNLRQKCYKQVIWHLGGDDSGVLGTSGTVYMWDGTDAGTCIHAPETTHKDCRICKNHLTTTNFSNLHTPGGFWNDKKDTFQNKIGNGDALSIILSEQATTTTTKYSYGSINVQNLIDTNYWYVCDVNGNKIGTSVNEGTSGSFYVRLTDKWLNYQLKDEDNLDYFPPYTYPVSNGKIVKVTVAVDGTTYIVVERQFNNFSKYGINIFKRAKYNIWYNANNPISDSGIKRSVIGTLPSNQIKVYDVDLQLKNADIKINRGYSFIGWNTHPDGSGDWYLSTLDEHNKGLYSMNKSNIMYAQWKPIEYDIYYEKGLTDDKEHINIGNATRNDNIQKKGNLRPYTHATYDKTVSMANLGELLGRSYKLQFNTNRPLSVPKQRYNSEAIPSVVNSVSSNLPTAYKWLVSQHDANNEDNPNISDYINPSLDALLKAPNYKDVQGGAVTATAQWNTRTLNSYTTPLLEDWKFIGWYDNQEGNRSVHIDNDNYSNRINELINTSANNNVHTDGNVIEITVKPQTYQFNEVLYARWQKTIHLTFDLNGGYYDGPGEHNGQQIQLTGIYYTNADGYKFKINNTRTTKNLPNYEDQINTIDAYGTYDANGINNLYMKNTENGNYRFLGWSLNKNATIPDTGLSEYDSSHYKALRLYDNTVLYAVWEPVLITNFEIAENRQGKSKINMKNLTAVPGSYTESITVTAGDNCHWKVTRAGDYQYDTLSNFGNITNLQKDTLQYYHDNSNPNDSDECILDYSGLNRYITTNNNSIYKEFNIPLYLNRNLELTGDVPYNPGTVHTVSFTMQKYSYYYNKVFGTTEKLEILIHINIDTPDIDAWKKNKDNITDSYVVDNLVTRILI